MIKIVRKEDCTGCHACYNICPQDCINMEFDNEGFLYPIVHYEKCIECNLCEKVCPIMHQENVKNEPIAYGCYNKNEEVRKQSSSGGIFTLISEIVIKLGGVVFGAGFDEDYNVEHSYIDKIEEIGKFRGSKYVQSKIGDTYKQAENILKNGRIVLFTGTPCQIGGLKSYLRSNYNNLICQDIVCHGVPSQYVWQHYKKFISKDRKLIEMNFRHKSTGWKKYSIKFDFEDGSYYKEVGNENAYIKGFVNNLYLRPSCYKCAYKTIHRQSDITLADFWGIEGILPDLDDDGGTSLIFVNNKKGQEIFDKIKNSIEYSKVDIEKSIEFNPCAVKSCDNNENRDRFINEYKNYNFNESINLITKIKKKKKFLIFLKKIRNKLSSIVKKWKIC